MNWLLAALLCCLINRGSCFNVAQWINELEKHEGYNKLVPPGYAQRRRTDVQLQLYMETLGNFRPQTMDFSADIYLIELWTDHRLRHNQSHYISLNDRAMIKRLWLPDTYFANSRQALVNDVPVPNIVLKISNNGTIRYSNRISLKLSCNMNLKAYPMDKQVCHIRILTYSSPLYLVKVHWFDNDPIILNPDIMEADLKIDRARIEADYCNGTRLAGKKAKVSCLTATLRLERFLGYSLVRTFIPSAVIVFMSWLSFWLDPESVPGRVALCMTTLLAQATRVVAAQFHLPPAAYVKAQDVWFGLCVLLHFGALVEFAVVNMYVRRNAAAAKELELMQGKEALLNKVFGEKIDDDDDSVVPLVAGTPTPSTPNEITDYRKRALIIDRVSMLGFPITFISLSIIYWSYYLSISPQYE